MNCSATQKLLCGEESCKTCYERSFATHPRASCWSSQNDIRAIQVTKSSNKKYKFDCGDCGHEILISLCNITNGQWCKYCNRDGLCDAEDCLFCYQKSFASHPMAEAWSTQNEITPRQIMRRSDKKFWFTCADCKHLFSSALYSINNDKHCPFCTSQQLCDNQECNSCFKKSCASHEMNKAWSSENGIQSRQVFLQSNKKVKFNCLVCFHVHETTPNHYYNRDNQCSYCSNRKICDREDCNACFQKSFASHPQIHCWSKKNTISPRTLFKGSEISGIFDLCHSEFKSKLYNVLTGYWCPYCKKKTEAKVHTFLKSLQGEWVTQLRFPWCRFSNTGNVMPFDFGSISKKILIEVDGAQHFTQISNWEHPENVQMKDIEKIKYCIKEGFSIIHINQLDIWNNVYDWKNIIQREIERLCEKEPQCSFISSKSIFDSHILKLDMIHYTVINPTT
jgi:very-short-patch-repair endonuclease